MGPEETLLKTVRTDSRGYQPGNRIETSGKGLFRSRANGLQLPLQYRGLLFPSPPSRRGHALKGASLYPMLGADQQRDNGLRDMTGPFKAWP